MAIRPCQRYRNTQPSVMWRRIFDRLAQAVITMGGIAVILSIIGIFIFLVKEVAPVFFPPQGTQTSHVAGAPPPEALPQSSLVGMDEYQEIIYQLTAGSDHQIRFFNAQSGAPITLDLPPALAKVHITSIARAVGTGNRFAFGTDDGRLIPVTIEFTAGFEEGTRHIVPTVILGSPVQLTPAKEHIIRLAYQPTERGTLAAALTDQGRLWYAATPFATAPVALTGHGTEPVTALIFDSRGETLSIGTAGGNLYRYDVREGTQPSLIETTSVAPAGTSVTALSYLIGDRSLAIGSSAGDVSVWMPVRQAQESSTTRFRLIHQFDAHPSPVTGISPSLRDKGFITGDTQGNLFVHYSTSAQTLLKLPGNHQAIRTLTFSPKADGAVALTDHGELLTYAIHNPHPETTLATLFKPVWYEGYERPEHVWQSSSGADDFEAKFGLAPADLRHAERDPLRHAGRSASGPLRRHLYIDVHAPQSSSQDQTDHRDHGGSSDRHPGLPGRLVAGACARTDFPCDGRNDCGRARKRRSHGDSLAISPSLNHSSPSPWDGNVCPDSCHHRHRLDLSGLEPADRVVPVRSRL